MCHYLYTTRLERALRQHQPGVSVLNLAVGGYTILQYAMVLDEIGLTLNPDLILVSLYPFNDFTNEDYDNMRRIANGGAPSGRWYHRWLVYHAYVFKLLPLLRLHGAPCASAALSKQDDDRRANLEARRHILEAGRSRTIPVVVAVLPTTATVKQQAAEFANVDGYCRGLGIDCINLLEPFARSSQSPRDTRLNQVDDHPNAHYQSVMADALAARIAPLVRPKPPRP